VDGPSSCLVSIHPKRTPRATNQRLRLSSSTISIQCIAIPHGDRVVTFARASFALGYRRHSAKLPHKELGLFTPFLLLSEKTYSSAMGRERASTYTSSFVSTEYRMLLSPASCPLPLFRAVPSSPWQPRIGLVLDCALRAVHLNLGPVADADWHRSCSYFVPILFLRRKLLDRGHPASWADT
jgi:hypothetical protein